MSLHPTYLQVFLSISLPIMGLAYALVGGLKLPLVERSLRQLVEVRGRLVKFQQSVPLELRPPPRLFSA